MGAAFAEGEAVATRLRYQDPDTEERVPAEGVRFTVTTQDGAFVGDGLTDADGNFELAVPGAGTYLLELDPTTLPEGVSLRDPTSVSATIRIEEGQTGRGIFGLSTGEESRTSAGDITFRRVAQLTVEGIKLGLFLGLAAIGLSLIFGTTGLVNFAHGEMITFGMLSAYFFNFYGLQGVLGFMDGWPAPLGSGVNLVFATLFAVVLGGGVGYSLDRWLFAPLRKKGASLISQMVVTIGLGILARYLFLFAFRGVPRFFKDYTAQTAIEGIPLIDITPKDLVAAILAIMILVGVGLYLIYTPMGKAMRAVSDNRDLAESSGIDGWPAVPWVPSAAYSSGCRSR
jgi:branched-chain amino acid transport system permease protein